MTFQGLKAVNVAIFLATRSSAQQNFSNPLCIIPTNVTTSRLLTLVDSGSALSAGFALNSPAHRMVTGFKSGLAPSELFKIARANLSKIVLTVHDIPAVGQDISVNLNLGGTASVVSYEVVLNDDATLVATGLAGALNTVLGANATATPVGATVEVVPEVDGDAFSIGWNSVDGEGVPHISVVDETTESLVNVIELATAMNNDFHFILAESRDTTDVLALADYATANSKQYYTSTSDVNVTDAANTSNIAVTLKAKAQDNVSLMYNTRDEFDFPEATLVGSIANLQPYRLQNQNFITLQGVTVDHLTADQVVTLVDRNTNYYTTDHGYPVYKAGMTMGGNFVDTIRFSIWLKVRCEESLAALLKEKADRGSALSYDDIGAAQMESRITTDVINVGIRGGTIATGRTTDPVTGSSINLNPYVNFGTRAQQTNADISNRVWRDGQVEVIYISGINYIKVNAYVALNRQPS